MGISSLLKELKSFEIPLTCVLLSCFGSMAIIDMSAWTHFAFNCLDADDLYALVFLEQFTALETLLQDWILRAYLHGVALRFVCEENHTPQKKRKSDEEQQRIELRATFNGLSASKAKKREKDMRRLCKRTRALLYALVTVAHTLGAQCVLAPVEADGQLAFLSRRGFLVLCNDSDVLALCHADEKAKDTARFIAVVANWSLTGPKKKKTTKDAEARLYDIRQLLAATAPSFLPVPKGISMVGALSTCDYSNIEGIGMAKASAAVVDHGEFSAALEAVLLASKAAPGSHDTLRRDARNAIDALSNPVIFDEDAQRLGLLDGSLLDPERDAHLMTFVPNFVTFTSEDHQDWLVFLLFLVLHTNA
jgi:hypothetical protein